MPNNDHGPNGSKADACAVVSEAPQVSFSQIAMTANDFLRITRRKIANCHSPKHVLVWHALSG